MRRVLQLTLCCWMLFGCQHFDRARECRALAEGVNPELLELGGKFEHRGTLFGDDYRAASALYRRAAKRLLGLKLKDSELSRLAKELEGNLTSASRSCDRIVGNSVNRVELVDPVVQQELGTLSQRHQTTVSAINRRCAD